MKTTPTPDLADAAPRDMDPSMRWLLVLGVLLALGLSSIYLRRPDFIDTLQLRLTDAIVAAAADPGPTGQVAVVDIDEHTLAAWGQWPWPRSLLARLLAGIADRGARCIALDFIMAEPDRTSATSPTDHDAVLAQTLSRGPFVLGYQFQFGDEAGDRGDCLIPPLRFDPAGEAPPGGALRLHQARGAVCNQDRLTRAAPQAGFLNGQVDADGRLRRLPLMIRYGSAVYPNLALAALRQSHPQASLSHPSPGGQVHLVLGPHRIPVDRSGSLAIRFAGRRSILPHVPAHRVLAGDAAEDDFRGRVVFVGLGAAGLAAAYPTPGGGLHSAVEVQAQALETILAGRFVRRGPGALLAEVLLALLAAVGLSLCVARFELPTTLAAGAGGLLACWAGAQLLFAGRQVLLSPLLPGAVIVSGVLLLTLFKYWTRQRHARRSRDEALVLMRRSQQELNGIIKTIPDIVFRLDAAGRITFISPAVVKYAKQPEELIGRHILDLVAPEDRAAAAYRINERRTGARATADLELRLLLTPADGAAPEEAERYFSISAEGIYTHNRPDASSFLGTQGIARDVTRRKHLERRLEQSQKMEAIGSLAAGVAHDLNNILSGLVSYPELILLDLPPGDPMRGKIETIQHSGQRAAEIVQDMLTIARRSVKTHAVLNVNDVVRDYLKTPEFRNLKGNYPHIRVDSDLEEGLLNTKGSALHLAKALMNLVSNAAEAMPAGGTIGLRTRNRYLDAALDRFERIPEGEYVLLRVSDEGVGIPPQDLKRIFEPFYSKKRMGRSGSGLGMTVVWTTVKDHGGFVDLQSQEGEGTRFDIYLPATREENQQAAHRVVLQDYTGTERLLVVDDIPEQCEIAARMLGKLGYRVASAASGEEALTYLETHAADLVVLDMVMPPGMDGLETYRRILERHPGQKAIIASGYASSERVQAMHALGAGKLIRKPYTLEKIGLAVRRTLDRPARPAPAPEGRSDDGPRG